jgi:hypothetical protein
VLFPFTNRLVNIFSTASVEKCHGEPKPRENREIAPRGTAENKTEKGDDHRGKPLVSYSLYRLQLSPASQIAESGMKPRRRLHRDEAQHIIPESGHPAQKLCMRADLKEILH